MTCYEMRSVGLGIAGVIISAAAFGQIRLLIEQNKKDHEEKRRLHTVELMMECIAGISNGSGKECLSKYRDIH